MNIKSKMLYNLDMEKQREPWDKIKEATGLIRHYVIGGHPGEQAIKDSGAVGQVEYYERILTFIMGWSGLSIDEAQAAIEASPDVIENTRDKPNFKPLYFQALNRIRKGKQQH